VPTPLFGPSIPQPIQFVAGLLSSPLFVLPILQFEIPTGFLFPPGRVQTISEISFRLLFFLHKESDYSLPSFSTPRRFVIPSLRKLYPTLARSEKDSLHFLFPLVFVDASANPSSSCEQFHFSEGFPFLSFVRPITAFMRGWYSSPFFLRITSWQFLARGPWPFPSCAEVWASPSSS